jgi:uncharacterized protein
VEKAWEDAVTRGDVEPVRQLLRAGADVNARDRHGQTALMLAAHRGYREMVETLVEGGADLNLTAKYNLSALMLAVTAGHFAGKTAHDLAVASNMEDLMFGESA